MKVLWLCSWYPNKLKPFDGDFIQRHARAVSTLHDVTTIFVQKDEMGAFTKNVLQETHAEGLLVEHIIFYKPPTIRIGIANKFISAIKYRKVFRNAIDQYISENGKPDLIHVHVTMKAGMLALWARKKYGIPYIVSEHWTGFLPDATSGIKNMGNFFRLMCGRILRGASAVTAVSKVLAEAIEKIFTIKHIAVVPNVVDTTVFYPGASNSDLSSFIHVSTMTYQKNMEQMLEAFQILKATNNFRLTIYTPDVVGCNVLVNQYGLQQHTIIKKEVSQEILANDVRSSDALVLYSRFETFGCVVIEANACGVPAILSDLPVFREYSIEGKTALFAGKEDPGVLTKVLEQFIETRKEFNKEEISGYIKNKFSYQKVASEFSRLYSAIVTLKA